MKKYIYIGADLTKCHLTWGRNDLNSSQDINFLVKNPNWFFWWVIVQGPWTKE
jgi:hypothetical protein